jgi:hypothetical protein
LIALIIVKIFWRDVFIATIAIGLFQVARWSMDYQQSEKFFASAIA